MKYHRLNEEQASSKFSFDGTSLTSDDLLALYRDTGYLDKIEMLGFEYLGFRNRSHVYAVLVADEEDVTGDDTIFGTTWYVMLGQRGIVAEPSGNSFIETKDYNKALSDFQRWVKMMKSKK